MDLDHFKKINDKYGHDFGDLTLIKFGKLVNKNLRKYDLLCRFGGEEFLILISSEKKESTKKIMERIRKSLPENNFFKKYRITVSGGFSEYRQGDSVRTIIKRADKALYISKKTVEIK